jgi:hypothetical protein
MNFVTSTIIFLSALVQAVLKAAVKALGQINTQAARRLILLRFCGFPLFRFWGNVCLCVLPCPATFKSFDNVSR